MITKLNALRKHAGFIHYFKNTIWLMGEQFLRIVSALFVGIWVARYLGPDQFGLFSYVLAFTAIFGGIAKLGLGGIVVRELVNYPEKRDILLGTSFWLKVNGAIIVMVLLAAIVPFTSNDAKTNAYIFIISTGLIFQSFEVIEFYLQSQVLAKITSICKVIQLTLSSIIKIYLVLAELELIYFVLITVFDALTLAFSYIVAYRLHKNTTFYRYFDFSLAKELLKDSWPLIFSSIVVMIYMRIDQIMIKEMLGKHEVGVYSAAVRLSEAFYFMPMLITATLFPAIINAKKQSDKLYKYRMQNLYTVMVWLAITISLPMTFLSDWLISSFFGQAYQEAGKVLVINIWASVFVFLGVASGNWFIVEKLQMLSFWRTFAGLIVNILLNLNLIPKYGAQGAALSTLISQFVAGYLFDLFNNKTKVNFIMKTKSLTGYSLFFT